jgi:hypothetical protein
LNRNAVDDQNRVIWVVGTAGVILANLNRNLEVDEQAIGMLRDVLYEYRCLARFRTHELIPDAGTR